MGIISKCNILGVDGGGTGCRVAIHSPTEGRLAESRGGPANFTTDSAATIKNILEALQSVASKASLGAHDLRSCAAHIGLAGVMTAADRDAVSAAMPFDHVTVSDDRETSVAGALGPRDGILAAIGTGTAVAARAGNKVRYFGGWGHQLADQASGGWLGRAALRCTLLAHDGLARHSDLTKSLLKHFNGDPIEMVHFAERAQPGDFAAFAPDVIDAARAKDANAGRLMNEGVAYLHRCFRAADLGKSAVICLAGGVGPHYEPYLNPSCRDRLQPPNGTALDGALALARATLAHVKAGS